MARAAFVSVHLARFNELRSAGLVDAADADVLFCGVASDTRAAGTEPATQTAFRFLVLGLHETAASADRWLDTRHARAPWLGEAVEVWSAVLQPFRHLGDCNYLAQQDAGPLFDTMAEAPDPAAPIIIVTTSGWIVSDTLDMVRVRDFSTGVLAVRASMTAVEGLQSQQSFFFPRGLEYDPLTLTVWQTAEAARAFAYGPGVHRLQINRQHAAGLADRTSFTRCRVVRSEGTWHGSVIPE